MSLQVPAPPPLRSRERSELPVGVILGIAVGVAVSIVVSIAVVLLVTWKRRKNRGDRSIAETGAPIRVRGVDSSTILSDAGTFNEQQLQKFDKFTYSAHPRITKFSYKELQKATGNFTDLLGSGAFGSVFKATLPAASSGTVLAVKVLSSTSAQGKIEFQTEVNLLARLHHKNLLNLLGYCTDRKQHILVYEFMSNGSLEKMLYDTKREPLSWAQRVLIAKDVARGIEYLHDGAVPPVIHRDIKSANILLDDSMAAKVADFGFSKEVAPTVPVSGVKGTYGYTDPEYIFTRLFTDKSDVYSFGVLLFELLSGRHPQQGLLDYVQMASMGLDSESADWSELLDSRLDGKCNLQELGIIASVAHRCIRKSPERRPCMRDVVQKLQRCGRRLEQSMSGVSFSIVVNEG